MSGEQGDLSRRVEAALQAGDSVEAIRLFREILSREPGHFHAAMWLARLLRDQGETVEALQFAELAAKIKPDDFDANLNLGFGFIVTWQPNKAIPVLERAIELMPESADAHFYLGFAKEQLGEFEDAESEIAASIELNPAKLESYVTLSLIQRKSGQNGAARLTVRRILERVAGSFEGNFQLGQTFIDAGDLEHGLGCLKRASALIPTSSAPYEAMGKAMLQVGRFSEAAANLEQAIAFNPDRVDPYMQITYCRKTTEAHRPLLQRMERLGSSNGIADRDRAAANYGLGRAYDDLGEYELAMAHFDGANLDARKRLANAPDKRERYKAKVDRIIETFTPEFLASNRLVGTQDETPIFVVGMIRSGTTLVEQIVSSHPDVTAGGELGCMAQRSKTVVPDGSSAVDLQAAQDLITDYVNVLRGIDADAPRITDKAPHNHVYAGVLNLLFPNARIIACRRNPIDNCLSAYMTPFATMGDFAHDKADIAFLYEQHSRLMDHWKQVLPADRFLELQYEEVVSEPETSTRQMIAFLGLPWNEACLNHEKNDRRITTPSAWQARQKIYSTAVDRWRNYEPWLGSFAFLL